jgi:hypothetical protein
LVVYHSLRNLIIFYLNIYFLKIIIEMDGMVHRNYQNLPKIGPVYSSKDEKQRVIAEEVLAYRIRPELKLKLNLNIPGLERKKQISPRNPETYRFFARMSSKGKEGWYYLWLMPNISRFLVPFFCVAFLYYTGEALVSNVYYEREFNNFEWETVYPKFQSLPSHYLDRWSLMA